MEIPCYITVFNQKKWLQPLIQDIKRIGGKPIILDKASTWDELKEWYKTQDVKVIYCEKNIPVSLMLDTLKGNPYFAITDPDLDLSSIPDDCIKRLLAGFEIQKEVWKVGLSLEIADLPDTEFKDEIIAWEKKFWTNKVAIIDGIDYYLADIDTTFAIYDMERFRGNFYGPALRVGRPYTARHWPWYYTKEQLLNDPELKVYYETADTRFLHWTRKLAKKKVKWEKQPLKIWSPEEYEEEQKKSNQENALESNLQRIRRILLGGELKQD